MSDTREWAVENDASELYADDVDDADADPLSFAEVADGTQPALSRLALDLRTYRQELLGGFDTREQILEWTVNATGATLGRLPIEFYEGLHTEVATDVRQARRPPLLAALLGDDVFVPGATAARMREQVASAIYAPAASRAVRTLRDDAQEVAPAFDETVIEPESEQHASMRPSLSEIESHQHRALEGLLAGFDDVPALLEWGDVLELATHGMIPDDWLKSQATSPVNRAILLGDVEEHASGREVIAAWLLEFFCEGVHERYRHAAEVSDPETTDNRSSTL